MLSLSPLQTPYYAVPLADNKDTSQGAVVVVVVRPGRYHHPGGKGRLDRHDSQVPSGRAMP